MTPEAGTPLVGVHASTYSVYRRASVRAIARTNGPRTAGTALEDRRVAFYASPSPSLRQADTFYFSTRLL